MFDLQDTTLRSTIAAERVERLAGDTAVGGSGTGLRRRLGSLLARAGRARQEQEPECIAPAPLPFRG
jgi:hypothetical protein